MAFLKYKDGVSGTRTFAGFRDFCPEIDMEIGILLQDHLSERICFY